MAYENYRRTGKYRSSRLPLTLDSVLVVRMFAVSLLIASFVTIYHQTFPLLRQPDSSFPAFTAIGMILPFSTVLLLTYLRPQLLLSRHRFWLIVCSLAFLINVATFVLTRIEPELMRSAGVALLLGAAFACILLCSARLLQFSLRWTLVLSIPIALAFSFAVVLIFYLLSQVLHENVVFAAIVASSCTNLVLLWRQENNRGDEPTREALTAKRSIRILALTAGIGALRELTRGLSHGNLYEMPDTVYLLLCLTMFFGLIAAIGYVLYRTTSLKDFSLTFGVPILCIALLCLGFQASGIVVLRSSMVMLGNTAFSIGIFYILILYAKNYGYSILPTIALGYLGVLGGVLFSHWVAIETIMRGFVLEFQGVLFILSSLLCGIALMVSLSLLIKSHATNPVELPAEATQDEQLTDFLTKRCLTLRQIEIALATAKGYSVRRIALELVLSDSTVRNHLSNVFKRLKIHSKQELIDLYQNKGSKT